MKKLFLLSVICSVALASCNSAHNKTSGATRDSSASHGNSGPADSSKAQGTSSPGASAISAGGSDTSHTGKATANPTVDSGKHK